MLGLLLLAPLAVTLSLTAVPALDVVFESPQFHVVVVTAIACCALVVAILTSVAATRAGASAPVLLAMGCLAVGILMFAHGLTTPGIWGRPLNMWVARLPVLALALFALSLGAAAAPDDSPLRRTFRRFPRLSLGTTSVILVGFALLLVLRPTALAGDHPLPGESLAGHLILAACALAFLLAGAIHWGRWRLGRDRVQLGLAVASWLSLNAALAFSIGQMWRISWWDYHLFLLIGFAAAVWCVFTEARRARSAADALATVSIVDPMEHITRRYPEALHALVGAVEAKDRHMLGHSSRVADIAVRVGLRLDLSPDALRGLAQGARLHDIGKIGVPDHVLNKQDSLSPEDWAWIERHPVIGAEMAARAPSLREALMIIRHHHERWDGSGYPDHLQGEDIPLAARVASLADVWDALTSDRAYRAAWAPDRALAHIAQSAERLFDPTVVEAFVDLVSEQGLWPERARLELEALAAAADACHPRGHGGSANGSVMVSSHGAPGR
jgi:HD-GYP domain-containing protein (c-di-GMP phosphodiesterase class II)